MVIGASPMAPKGRRLWVMISPGYDVPNASSKEA